MGVYIKDMNKPKNCGECPLMIGSYCAITDNFYFEEADYDPTSCPIEEIDLVRCGECKRCEERTTLNGLPFLYCLKMEVSVGSDQYCYWGERRNDNKGG